MGTIVALTGASGNMGREALRELACSEKIEKIALLLLNTKKERKLARKLKRRYRKKVEVIFGDISNFEDCRQLVSGVQYVLNLAAVIPPTADHYPELAEHCNHIGAKNIADAVSEITENQPKLVHISTVALYGNRNYLHPWGRVGDPLLPSVFDSYAASKLKGERYVLESEVKTWVVLRQTALLHSNMLQNNMHDGLMFHTCFNVPLEWVTAKDSGRLIRNLVEKDMDGMLTSFWKKCYNIGGGAENRVTGYDTFDQGFRLIGGTTEKFLKPSWNSIRNFHGLWFSDGDILNSYLHYQTQNVKDYWSEILNEHKFYKIIKLLPQRLISKYAVERLLKDQNSPRNWVKSNDNGRIRAFFGSKENLRQMPTDWKDYPVLAKGELSDANIDYEEIKNIANVEKLGYLLEHGYDETKEDKQLDLQDMREAAAFRGGKCLATVMEKGDLYTKLEWECHDGHSFFASPYTVLKAGHWCPECCQPGPWQYDRLAKFMPFYSQVWYDSHARGENYKYYYDSEKQAKCEYIAS